MNTQQKTKIFNTTNSFKVVPLNSDDDSFDETVVAFHIPHRKFFKKLEPSDTQLDELSEGDTIEIESSSSKIKDISNKSFSQISASSYGSSYDLENIELQRKPPPPTTDIDDLIQNKIPEFEDNSFIYLNYSAPNNSEFFTPYSLIEVPFSRVNLGQFFTISRHGVTFWKNRENHFTRLEQWYSDYLQYCDLMKIKSFRDHRLWKGFKVWQKTIHWRKYLNAQNFLAENLFFVIPGLRRAILQFREEYCQLIESNFLDMSVIENWHLFYFNKVQMKEFEKLRQTLRLFRSRMKELLYDECHNSLIAKGFHPNDEITMVAYKKRLRKAMSFAKRSRKRDYCKLLSRFLTYCDNMTITLLQIIIKNSFRDLVSAFKVHEDLGPTIEDLNNEDLNIELEIARPSENPQNPMFFVNLVLTPDKVDIDPSEDVMNQVFQQLTGRILEAVDEIERFTNDPFFLQFTEPSIMGRQEDRLAGKPPDLRFVLKLDKEHQNQKKYIQDAIRNAYKKVGIYIRRFEPIRLAYETNMKTSNKTIRAERDLNTLSNYCEQFNTNLSTLEKILPSVNLGVLKIKQEQFKDAATPISRNLLKVLKEYLPGLASEQVKKLTEMGRELIAKLNSTPKSIFDFVEYLRYLDDSGKELEKCLEKADYIHNLFSIMNKYNIVVKDNQKEKYMGCDDLLLKCQKTIETKTNERQEFVHILSESILVEVEGIFEDVAEVRAEYLDEKYIDKNTNLEDAKSQLTSLMDRLQQCQEQANEFIGYQKEFKIERTRFDELTPAIQDVKHRQNLWNTFEEWETALSRWQYVDFNTLDVDELNKINSHTLNMCMQFEKFLPPNELVVKLKQSAEVFYAKLPVIACLRNPTLKARHWVRIENLINEKVYEEIAIKLSLYEKAHVFEESIANEIIEISSHASAEAELEVKLKKVENTWKELDLVVVPHRESRDLFVLSGIEELQITLDEMNVIINTIAASKHVTPIKSRVDEWVRLLEIFGNTLEEWLACQSSWIYLEAIFSAADIKRQLPQESRMFNTVNKSWKEVMYQCYERPLALPIMTDKRNLEIMANNNVLLESITRCLEAYLETKRVAFPRFYFLSNDELLEILAQTRNPHAVQPYLRKCFDAIGRLEFGFEISKDNEEFIYNKDIIAMISPEGERMTFYRGLKARGPVEDWLGKVEQEMYATVKRHIKLGYNCYNTTTREEWFQEHANQVVLMVTQQQWTAEVSGILDGKIKAGYESSLKDLEAKLATNLAKLAALTRENIPPLVRRVLCALITLDVHAKDTVTNLITKNVKSSNDFDWLKMLRVYWSTEFDNLSVRMASASSRYFNEYLGAGGVLVITPLTDRCYLCLMGALQMNLGGSPTGPAGTGKTETTKDLAKAIAKQCVVFNCSEGLDYKMMGRFFSGLAQTGAWCCFDEFNRIDIEVLSVIAQQLITIRNAKALELERFMFEGREMKLNMTCAAFITMNPGYAGRTELPDNLKALFRPIAMMVPDYALISEVILYSEGFESPKNLAQKMVQLYKLCSEQLSQQSHYDFGLRAVKSVLVMAGTLKRAAPHQREDLTLITAMRDSNLPKFIAEDALLFKYILNDLFPGTELPITESGHLQKSLDDCFTGNNLQSLPTMITKCVQVYETLRVRCGVMLVGPTGGGKTTVLHTLASALTKLSENNNEDSLHYKVNIQTLNPKAITLDELFGAFDSLTMEWKDGLLGMAMRSAVSAEEGVHQWIVCDGPVDAAWIENMNTVLDDNKMLCLSNSERIKLTPWVRMIFEVEDLTQASPATVSRCGMVYIDPTELSWLPIVQSWIKTINEEILIEEYKDYLFTLFEKWCEDILNIGLNIGKSYILQVNNSKVKMVCQLLASQIYEIKNINLIKPPADVQNLLKQLFYWSMAWSVGSNFDDESRNLLDGHLAQLLMDEIKLPKGKIWDFRLNLETKKWENWSMLMDKFVYNPDDKYFDMLVPTSDSVKFGYIAELLLSHKIPILLSGQTGVGKSVLAKSILKKLSQIDFVPILLNFSAQTSSLRTQQIIESRLEKRKKGQLGAAIGKTVIIFIDDVNMPKLDTYGSQSPIELLRQYLDYKGFYDRDKLLWKEIRDVTLGAACAPPGGGRNTLTSRFVRHFAVLNIPSPNDETLNTIFSKILKGHLQDFNPVIQPLAIPLVKAAVDVYSQIEKEFLPTPEKSHYTYNLRDLSKCIQGVLQSDPSSYITEMQILRLFYHESLRVLHDRLVNSSDKSTFLKFMDKACQTYFEKQVIKPDETLLFGDFMVFGQGPSERMYEEIKDEIKLQNILFDYLDDYNTLTGKHMKLIFFQDAMEHTVRLARLLRADRGNGLLVGIAGMGKQSLTRLAAHINGYTCFQIQLTRNYDMNSFHDDLRILYRAAGVNNTKIVFLLIDTQIVKEEILEDINNILNSGEVPNLFEGEDLEQIIIDLREVCNSQNQKDCNRDEIFKLFIERVRTNLHLVACMSPVGESFRRRCKMFPSLVNCCTIDWFINWPSEALYSVALGLLEDVVEKEQERESLAAATVYMHKTVGESAEKYFKELRRHYYTTPSSYLELLRLYQTLLKTQTDAIINKRNRISSGLNKILETNETLAVMQKDLQVLVPLLEEQSTAMKELLLKLEQDTKNADMVKESVIKEEAISKEKAAICQAISDDASKDLEIAMPALRQAEEALKSLNKTDINELKAFTSPPQLIQFVMEAVCILLGAKPTWPSAKAIMTDINFLKKLIDYDKEHIPETVQKKIKKYVEHKDFNPIRIEKVSKVAKSVSVWVIAIDKFAKVFKVVEPKIRKQEVAESELKEVMKVLRTKQQQLAEVEAQIQYLKDKIEDKNLEFRRIQDNVDLTTARIIRAGRLTSALADEEIRWGETVKKLSAELKSIPGDVLIAAACTAYLGAFSSSYRKDLCSKWVTECQGRGIPSSPEFNIVNILGDPFEMRNWNIHGLPRDNISMENGLYVTCALRWPLMIDPQEQANRWIRSLEQKNNLQIIKMTNSNLLRILENCIRNGYPILIEDLGETIDPVLLPILNRSVVIHEGRSLIKLGDTIIDFDKSFKLYMTTKLSNPHYMPEICTTVTLINFLVTSEGLEDQLLTDIVAIELPELEKQRSDLIVKINSDRQQLLALEDKVLKLLFAARGNILDDEELVETLNESKETTLLIGIRLEDTEDTESVITATREKYRTLSCRGSLLYFIVVSLSDIDPMYQYSLKYFTQIFCAVLHVEHQKTTIEVRIENLKAAVVEEIYANVSRGLFEKHKLIFSFLLATAIEIQTGHISDQELNFIYKDPVGDIKSLPKPDQLKFLSNAEWSMCLYLEENFKGFEGFSNKLQLEMDIEIGDFHCEFVLSNAILHKNSHFGPELTIFEKLMLIKAFKKEKLINAVGAYVRLTLGKSFTEDAGDIIEDLYRDTNNITPLIFILSPGSDPFSALLRFTEEMDFTHKFFSISLGQGQGPAAEVLLETGRTNGHWIFLQNCHLATSWMNNLEDLVRNLFLGITQAHTDFRLYLSSMPMKSFPISILQNSVKVTNEPPRGLKANVVRALNDMNKDFFEHHVLGEKWRALIFGLCMFHGIIIERRKFGPLGWNILYQFNESDRDCGLKILETFIDREIMSEIPWDALSYVNGEITWGGRVTDFWDHRCLRTILDIFSSPKILNNDYIFGDCELYYDPKRRTLDEYKEYVSSLPFDDNPGVFGMHENANMVYQTKESEFFLKTLLDSQPSVSDGKKTMKNNEVCLDILNKIKEALPMAINSTNCNPQLLERDNKQRLSSLTTVLFQEIDRHNNLLNIIHNNLNELEKAIKGFVVMSDYLESIFKALLHNLVPEIWSQHGFLSIKTLFNWTYDFQRRIDFIQTWYSMGPPESFWISGFFFPQSFLTGILQTHARINNIPIDCLMIDFEVLNEIVIQHDIFEIHQTKKENNVLEISSKLPNPPVGVYVHGLFIEASNWDSSQGGLCDPKLGQLYSRLPVIWFKPCTQIKESNRYEAPLYKTQARAGILSTTGHSTNFILSILLASKMPKDFWILRGTAIFTSVAEDIS